MKKNLITIILITISLFTYSQKRNSITINGGFVDYNEESIGAMITFTKSKNNSNYEIGVSHFIFEKLYNNKNGNFTSSNINLGYLYTFLRDRSNTLNFNIGGGAFAGYEKINETDELIIKSESNYIGGFYASLNFDIYLFENFALNLKGNQYYLIKSTTGNLNPFVAVGVKYNF
ncbi:MAG: hypothetical protein HC854_04065 [Flavobacterium sp.]|nr:hypothetical protein [Flavobacterium sp.]